MSELFHNSFDLAYRSPFGAVAVNTPVTLAVDAPEGARVRLRVWTDGERLLDGERRGGRVYFTYTPEFAGAHWYFFVSDGADGRTYLGGSHGAGAASPNEPQSFHITAYEPWEAPRSFAGRIAYQIFPDRFFGNGLSRLAAVRARGRRAYAHEAWNELPDYLPRDGAEHYEPVDYFGGTLDGIREKLPYLKTLNVGVIYLNPIFEAASNHRYNTSNYLEIDPVLGTESDLRRLAEEARALDITLMLDGVFSHTGDDSVYFDRFGRFGGGAYGDERSPYRRWYSFNTDGSFKCWWGFKSLPEVDENDAGYREFIAGVLKKWASFGITSWRLDVADELPDSFIEFLRRELKALDKNGALIGEVWEDAATKEGPLGRRHYVDGRELDGVMNYPRRAAILGFLLGKCDAPSLADFLWAEKEGYPPPFYASLLNSISTHDTVRALTALSGAVGRDELTREQQATYEPPSPELGRTLMRLATLLQFALPGVPCIYYGDEAGLTGMADPFSRRPFPWDAMDAELLEFTRRVTAIYGASRDISEGGAEFEAVGGDVLKIQRESTLICLNRGEAPFELALHGEYRDALSGTVSAGKFTLPPLGAAVLEKICSTNSADVVY